MLKDFEFFHGVVFARITHSGIATTISQFSSKDNASYIYNRDLGLYIKFSQKRLTPWRFTFLEEQRQLIQNMKQKLKDVFISFVCNEDGICCINFEEYCAVQCSTGNGVKWVSVERSKGQEYRVRGSDGELHHKIADSEFPSKMLNSIEAT